MAVSRGRAEYEPETLYLILVVSVNIVMYYFHFEDLWNIRRKPLLGTESQVNPLVGDTMDVDAPDSRSSD